MKKKFIIYSLVFTLLSNNFLLLNAQENKVKISTDYESSESTVEETPDTQKDEYPANELNEENSDNSFDNDSGSSSIGISAKETKTEPRAKFRFDGDICQGMDGKGIISIDDLSFETNANTVNDLKIEIDLRENSLISIDEIHIPDNFIFSESLADSHLLVTAVYEENNETVIKAINFKDEGETILLEHDFMIDTKNNLCPEKIIFEFKNENTAEPISNLVQEKAIDLYYSTNNCNVKTENMSDEIFSKIKTSVSWNDEDNVSHTVEENLSFHHNSLSLSTRHEYNNNLELFFEINNFSKLKNSEIYLAFESDALELSDNSVFYKNDKGDFELELKDENGDFIVFDSSETKIFSDNFIVKESLEDDITIKPYLYTKECKDYPIYSDKYKINISKYKNSEFSGLDTIFSTTNKEIDLLNDVELFVDGADYSDKILIYDADDNLIENARDFSKDIPGDYILKYQYEVNNLSKNRLITIEDKNENENDEIVDTDSYEITRQQSDESFPFFKKMNDSKTSEIINKRKDENYLIIEEDLHPTEDKTKVNESNLEKNKSIINTAPIEEITPDSTAIDDLAKTNPKTDIVYNSTQTISPLILLLGLFLYISNKKLNKIRK